MAKPLRSDDPTPQNMQFAHFGVLNDGNQSKASLFTSITLNIVIALCAVIIGAAAKKTIDTHHKLTELTEPIPIKKAEEPPPPPKIKIKLPPPPVVKVEPPKIKLPDVKLPDVPKPPEIKMAQPMPVVLPAPPKIVTPPPAPVKVNLAQAMPASVPNNCSPSNGRRAGFHHQSDRRFEPSSATCYQPWQQGNVRHAGRPITARERRQPVVNLGSGSATSQNMNGHNNAAAGVVGVKLGVTGGTGPMNAPGRSPGVVNLGQNTPPPMPKPAGPTADHREERTQGSV